MTQITKKELKKKYLDLLSQDFDTPEKLTAGIISLEPVLELPKGTEHFVDDLRGECEAFQHILHNGSGNVRAKVNDIFKERLSTKELNDLTALVYYPEDKLKLIEGDFRNCGQLNVWYITTIGHLIELIKYCSSKYTRPRLCKALLKQYIYIIEELLYKNNEYQNKKSYYGTSVNQVIELKQTDGLIIGLTYSVQRLVVDHLHVIGDIYDYGPQPDKIMDTLINYHSLDIQWGSHDVLRVGAYTGSEVYLANLLRICAHYDNLDTIEDAYDINLRPLFTLTEKYYDTDNPAFKPGKRPDKYERLTQHEKSQTTKIHQTIAIIQFKLEMPIIEHRPNFEMEERLVPEKVNYDTNEVTAYSNTYPLKDTYFQAVNHNSPAELLPEEEEIMNKLLLSFQQSEELHRRMSFLMRRGSLYLSYNGNLLIHDCIPIDENGEMESFEIDGHAYGGQRLLDVFEYHARKSFNEKKNTGDLSTDLVWYLWAGKYSSLFGKRAVTTFERYFIANKASHKEEKNPYYHLHEDMNMVRKILSDFGLNPDEGRITNGHTPVEEISDEDPIKADGKMPVIDSGFSKAYQSTTGIAGYTPLYNSSGMQLVTHQQFNAKGKILSEGVDELSIRRVVDKELQCRKIRDTNIDKDLQAQIDILRVLIHDRYLD